MVSPAVGSAFAGHLCTRCTLRWLLGPIKGLEAHRQIGSVICKVLPRAQIPLPVGSGSLLQHASSNIGGSFCHGECLCWSTWYIDAPSDGCRAPVKAVQAKGQADGMMCQDPARAQEPRPAGSGSLPRQPSGDATLHVGSPDSARGSPPKGEGARIQRMPSQKAIASDAERRQTLERICSLTPASPLYAAYHEQLLQQLMAARSEAY